VIVTLMILRYAYDVFIKHWNFINE
jgi:hypothetical protein